MSSSTDSAYVWSMSVERRPDLWLLAASAFNFSLEWREILTKPERRMLIHWAAYLGDQEYADWYDWAAGRTSRQMRHILRDPLPEGDPRRVPNHVETRAMRRRRAVLEQEPELIYRMRRQMEVDRLHEAEENAMLAAWWEHRQEESRERRRAEAGRAEAARVEAERRQMAHLATCSFRLVCERASGPWARMRQIQAEEAAAAEEDQRAREEGESSDSNQMIIEISDDDQESCGSTRTVIEISDDDWIDISSDESDM